ncbi:MAG TPA: methylmalonyl Co-A mutase-associated GTPase MeaB [Polyangiaceae bacterium]|nr:methylmalonyl Co-A mutase-associated GTPase MeaB [Polyangiaceae bacterium]
MASQPTPDPQRLASEVIAGDVPAAARACRWVDDGLAHKGELLKALYSSSGKGWRVGVTGVAGAGKSTLVDQLISAFRALGHRVAVVAVDPSSPFSGGAILGDRIRMQRHSEDPQVFIRSLASRGDLGGISSTTLDVTRVLEAWGAQVVIIETVGVGQAEVDVMRVADTTLVVVPPGLGDQVQAAKAGLLEIADIFAVNKADLLGVDAAVRDLEGMLSLRNETSANPGAHAAHAAAHAVAHAAALSHDSLATGEPADNNRPWTPRVLRSVATTGEGTADLLSELQRHRAWLTDTDAGKAQRLARTRWEIRGRLQLLVARAVHGDLQREIEAEVQRIESGQSDPYSAEEALLERFRIQTGRL